MAGFWFLGYAPGLLEINVIIKHAAKNREYTLYITKNVFPATRAVPNTANAAINRKIEVLSSFVIILPLWAFCVTFPLRAGI